MTAHQELYRIAHDLDRIAIRLDLDVTPGNLSYMTKKEAAEKIKRLVTYLLHAACDTCHGTETIPEPDDGSPNIRRRCPDCIG